VKRQYLGNIEDYRIARLHCGLLEILVIPSLNELRYRCKKD